MVKEKKNKIEKKDIIKEAEEINREFNETLLRFQAIIKKTVTDKMKDVIEDLKKTQTKNKVVENIEAVWNEFENKNKNKKRG